MNQKLEDAGGATQAQSDLNKRRETELLKLRMELEDCRSSYEGQITALKKKQQEGLNELSEQVEHLEKTKAKLVPLRMLWLSAWCGVVGMLLLLEVVVVVQCF